MVTYSLHPGDIVLGEASGSPGEVGKPGLWAGEIDDCAFQNTLVRVRSRGPEPRYLLHYFRHLARSGAFADESRGVGIHHIGRAKLAAWLIPIPPANEQRRIVDSIEDHFSRLDAASAELSSSVSKISYLPSLIAEAAARGTLGIDHIESVEVTASSISSEVSRRTVAPLDAPKWNLPEGWRWASLDSLSEFVVDGDHNPPKRVPVGVPHITAKGVRDGRISVDGCTFVSKQGFAQTAARYLPRPKDVIVTCVGTIGRVAIVPPGLRFSADRNLAAARLLATGSLPEFVALALNSVTLQRRMDRASGSTAQPHLYLRDLRSLPVPLPPIGEQVALVRRACDLDDVRLRVLSETRKAQERMTRLRRALLEVAFSGGLTGAPPNIDQIEELAGV